MACYPTPHINATPEDFAKTVIMPGDPMRSKFIAENFLSDAKLVNDVRGVKGYTGNYKGTRLSVMASGMGIPSMAIYSHELYNFFDVNSIIRIGSAGAISDKVDIGDIVIGMGACTDSVYAENFGIKGGYCPIADFELLNPAVNTAKEKSIKTAVGNIITTEIFYNQTSYEPWSNLGVLAVEMETAALYINAAKAGKKALAMYTVSDNVLTGEGISAEEREKSFVSMIELALCTALKIK